MWYDFDRWVLQRTGECTLPRECQCDRDQRGGPNQISFGERYAGSGDGGFTEHKPDERFRSSSQHGLFHGERDGHNEYGGDLEFEWGGMQRHLLWVPGNEFAGGCLYGASGGSFTSKCDCGCDQCGGSEQIRVSNGNNYVRYCRHRESG